MERLLTDRKNDAQETPPVDTPYARFKTENGEREEKAEEKTQSPLQGIANKTILRYIQNYLNSQND